MVREIHRLRTLADRRRVFFKKMTHVRKHNVTTPERSHNLTSSLSLSAVRQLRYSFCCSGRRLRCCVLRAIDIFVQIHRLRLTQICSRCGGSSLRRSFDHQRRVDERVLSRLWRNRRLAVGRRILTIHG